MQIKTFEAPTLEDALRRVREVFGNNALIVSTDRVRKGGPVRVTAAREHDSVSGTDRTAVPDNGVPINDPVPMLRRALAECGVDGDLATTLLTAAHYVQTPVAPAVALAAAFENSFRFRPMTTKDGAGLLTSGRRQSLILVGPPGAGKTVTVAKLAARVQSSGASLRTVTIDTRKTAGAAHLEALGRHLTIGISTARSVAELSAIVSGNRCDVTLIDTFGVNPFDEIEMSELNEFVTASGAEPVLVLPAGVEQNDAEDIASVFAAIGCQRAIVTRIDLTRRLGSLLGAFHGNRIAFSDVSVSPDILPPESGGLRPLNPVALARLILPDPVSAESKSAATLSKAKVLAS